MTSILQRLQRFQREDQAASERAHKIVLAYLKCCESEDESPAAIIRSYLDRKEGREWFKAAAWILDFDPRPYLDGFRRRGDEDEDEDLDEGGPGYPDPQTPEW